MNTLSSHRARLAAHALLLLGLLCPLPALAAETKKVVITGGGLNEQQLAEFRSANPSLQIVVANADQAMTEVREAHAIIGRITAEMVRAAPKLEWVQVSSAGVETVLFPELKNSQVVLTNMKIVQGPEIADHAFALLLGLTRSIPTAVKQKETQTWARLPVLKELRGKTAVVVGVGGIGSLVAYRAKAFGMRVIGVDIKDLPLVPYLDESVRTDRLDTVLPKADVLFICAPHTQQTEKLIRTAQFALMPKGAYFICVSRGKIYEADELASAVSSGQLSGAGIDVVDPEPLPPGHALWKLENVIITPHIAGRSDGEWARYDHIYRENFRRFANGEPLLNVVDKQAGF
jgi:phosphoglycerate dehydrogenase-like enzyme